MLRKASNTILQQVAHASAADAACDGVSVLACRLVGCGAAQSLGFSRAVASSAGPTGPRPEASRPAAAASAAAASTSGNGESPLSVLARQQRALASMPLVPKMLGFAGAIPFLTLTPSFLEAAGLPDLIEYCSKMQLVYGGSIVTFLGAVHWGLAMNSANVAAAGTKAASALRERYVWSVVPSLAAVPALLMQPAQGSLAISVLLGICYMSDSSYFRSGYLPSWYMTLRGYLTLLAIVGMLSTTAYYFSKDMEKARKRMEEDDAKRAARLEARAAAMTGSPAAAAAAQR